MNRSSGQAYLGQCFDLVLRHLGSGRDERKLGALICSVEVVASGMIRVEATEQAKNAPIETLDELVANADGLGMLGG